MDRPHAPPQENKLLLMYVFHKVGAMTNLQAIRFMIENEIMDYLDLQLTLAELTESGFMQVLPVDDARYYTLTGQAQDALAYFRKLIPASRRASIDGAAQAWRDIFRQERMLTCDYQKNAAGDYTVHLVAREEGKTLVDLRLSVASADQAKQLCATWEQNASLAYKVLIDTLLRNDQAVSAAEPSGEDERSEPLNENNL